MNIEKEKQENCIKFNFKEYKVLIKQNYLTKKTDNSIYITSKNNAVLSTLVVKPLTEIKDFFPLSINCVEKFFASGQIPRNFFKREGKPSDVSVLISRILDRTLRCNFVKEFDHEVQITHSILSLDENEDIKFLLFLSTFLLIFSTNLPFKNILSALNIVLVDGEFIILPTLEQSENATLEMWLAANSKDKVIMIESFGKENTEEVYNNAFSTALEDLKLLNTKVKEASSKLNKVNFNLKNEFVFEEDSNENKITFESVSLFFDENLKDNLKKIIDNDSNLSKSLIEKEVEIFTTTSLKKLIKHFDIKNNNDFNTLKILFENVKGKNFKVLLNEKILTKSLRLENRKLDQLRDISCMNNILPSVHGSAVFERGNTKVLSTITLGSFEDKLRYVDLTSEKSKHFFHHYNFHSFSVGEITKAKYVSRREIGHGSLCEKAILQILPSVDEFPYTIRAVSEVVCSDGSTSQASICAVSLSLMQAGVPIKNHVAGISVGLIEDKNNLENYKLLLDMEAQEDFFGEMDFKVSGTKNGINYIQLDLKNEGLTLKQLSQALTLAKKGRLQILEIMNNRLNKTKALPSSVDKVEVIEIEKDDVKVIIGSGGKTINKIIEDCDNIKINIIEDSKVLLYHKNIEVIEKAKNIIKSLTYKVKINDIFIGKVEKILNNVAIISLTSNYNGFLPLKYLKKKPFLKDRIKVKVVEKFRDKLQLKPIT